MDKISSICKTRWPEIVLIIGLQTAVMILLNQVNEAVQNPEESTLPDMTVFLVMTTATAIGVLWQIIKLGFLRTAHLSGNTKQDPTQLVITGRPFFWRIFWFELGVGVIVLLIGLMLTGFLNILFQSGNETLKAWMMPAGLLISTLLLAKVILIVPAVMVVCDCRIRQALIYTSTFKLTRSPHLLSVFFLLIACQFSIPMIIAPMNNQLIINIAGWLQAGILSILTLWVALAAVEFVSVTFTAAEIPANESGDNEIENNPKERD